MRHGRWLSLLATLAIVATSQAAPENLALRATVTADSEYSGGYLARFVADGNVPELDGRNDPGKAWAVKGATHGGGATLMFEWTEPVSVADIVYFGRTSFANECWKGYEVLVDDVKSPLLKGDLKSGHGGQRIRLAKPVRARKLYLRFTSSYGGPNPGAAEVQVFAVPVPDAQLGKFIALAPHSAGGGFQAPPPPQIGEAPELLALLKDGGLGFTKLLLAQRHHIRCSHVYTYHCEGQQDGGGLSVYDVTTGDLEQILASPNGQICGCDLSYDGRKIAFSWRKGRYYQVYTVNTDGSDLQQLTDGTDHNYDACWLPDGDIIFLSTRQPQAAYCFFTPVGILYRMRPDGTAQACISANYLNDFTPAVLNDGRIIYGRWEYVDRPAIPIQSLWTINPDGTCMAGFFGNRVLDPASFIEPQAIPGSTKILCTLTGHNGSCRGAIGIIDRSLGDNAREGIRNITPEIRLRGVGVSSNGPRGPYQTPYPVDDAYYLVSHDGTLLLRDYEMTQQATVLKPQDGMGFYNPRPIRTRRAPSVRASTLPEDAGDAATVFVRDVYRGLEPHVKRGVIKQLCVVEELARALIDSKGIRQPAFDFQRIVVSCGATYVPKRVLGYADVNEDGSAHFRVPARKPIYFLALDAEGRAVQRMRSFVHLMPGEVQGCVGCHEPREETARLRQFPSAPRGEPRALTPPEWGVMGFNYREIVQPVLDRHCVRCHGAMNPPKGVDLTGDLTDYFNVSYETLARGRTVHRRRPGNEVSVDNPYTKWIPTYNGQERNILAIAPRTWGSPASKLADLVLAGHPDKDGKPRCNLNEAECRRLLAWMDLNVPYYGTADTAYPENQACRRQYPAGLDKTLVDVGARRCISCHASKDGKSPAIPRKAWTRITNPHLNNFLLGPLARDAGGTEACGAPVFKDKDDPDYQAILRTFDPVLRQLIDTPRMDMAGARPAMCLRREL